ncbi:hypothetical protein DCS_05677 [Drechmeria coniospora]|uniref:Uncharacterized protein n=1 Tax=Drechmeria coniospora TaxID=98403 RepID=A0A151GNJ4_DRECN|nr:hypothetical protein DCS_05677 [Drechmeria coniospora]KYK58660.1 hypothetical protein DCS_05677 [Drechmeria coniospora]
MPIRRRGRSVARRKKQIPLSARPSWPPLPDTATRPDVSTCEQGKEKKCKANDATHATWSRVRFPVLSNRPSGPSSAATAFHGRTQQVQVAATDKQVLPTALPARFQLFLQNTHRQADVTSRGFPPSAETRAPVPLQGHGARGYIFPRIADMPVGSARRASTRSILHRRHAGG